MDLRDIALPIASSRIGSGPIVSSGPELTTQVAHHASHVINSVRAILRVDFAGYWSIPDPHAHYPRLVCLGIGLPDRMVASTDRATTRAYDILTIQAREVLSPIFQGQDYYQSDLWAARHAPEVVSELRWAKCLGLRGVYARPVTPNGQLVGVIAAGTTGTRWVVTAQMVGELRRLGNRAALGIARLATQLPFQESVY